MTDRHLCEEKELLVAYLYGECDDAERRAVDAHLATCSPCAEELEGLRAVRGELARWTPPEQTLGFAVVQTQPRQQPWWMPRAPALGLAAAAVLVLAAAAGVASLEVRYGADGLVIRTGWARSAASSSQPSASVATSGGSPWRGDLVALERRLREEFAAPRAVESASAVRQVAPGPVNEAELLRRIRALIDESERRQQRELALRLAQMVRDFDNQRRTDLVRVQQGLGRLEGLTGAEVLRQREMLNYLIRVSQQPR